MPKKTVVFIDGENFLFGVAGILKSEKKIKHKSDISHLDIGLLQESALSEFNIDEIRFYAAKVHVHKNHPELLAKSIKIVESQRRLKRSLTNQGVDFIISGNVRLQDSIEDSSGKVRAVFKEKGTDVRIAVDMVSMTCDKELSTAILLSSDSDMQPVVREMKKRGVKVIYVGFQHQPNAGLSISCDQTVLLRKKEILDAWEGSQKELL